VPHLQITLLEGRTVEQKRRAVKRITEVMHEELNVRPEALSIVFVEVSREDYARNGVLIADRADLTGAIKGES
jgi:4-oxalocrotonate tautomerase